MIPGVIETADGVWQIKRLVWAESNLPGEGLPRTGELWRPEGLEAFAARAIAAADGLRAYAEQTGFNLLEAPVPHIDPESVIPRDRPHLSVTARAIAAESGITAVNFRERTRPRPDAGSV